MRGREPNQQYLEDYARHCRKTGKVVYRSEAEARKWAKKIRKAAKTKMKAYVCPWCHWWHIGHPRKGVDN